MRSLGRFELEWRLIYTVIVAGKTAKFADGAMLRLFPTAIVDTPFNLVRQWKSERRLAEQIRACRTGNYGRIERCLVELTDRAWDLTVCTVEQLEAIHGIGPKTARFFILWTRPGERYAALDVHVLRWLRGLGHDAPASTPTGRKYRELEKVFLDEADRRKMSPRELDAEIWEKGSGYR